MLLDLIAGTRLDFYKIGPIVDAVLQAQQAGADIGYRVVYTGRQSDFDEIRSDFVQMQRPEPNVCLDVDDEHTGAYTGSLIARYDKVLRMSKPELVLLTGNSTGTMACAVAAAKIPELKIAHIEAGMYGNDRVTENEVNGRIADAVTDYHFPITQNAGEQLRKEGIADDFIFFVGNPISDFIFRELDTIPKPTIWDTLHLQEKKYILLNLENPAVTGSITRLKSLLLNIIRVSRNLPLILPVNNTSADTLNTLGIKAANLHITDKISVPKTYYLARYAKVVITDTEFLQDETTVMQTPCITLLKSVARSETHITGFNEVTGLQPEPIADAFQKLFTNEWKKGKLPYLWDGKASTRILAVLKKLV